MWYLVFGYLGQIKLSCQLKVPASVNQSHLDNQNCFDARQFIIDMTTELLIVVPI